MTTDPVTIVLPKEGYEKVARLVAAGVVSRLGFGYETVDDVQLAIELVLHAAAGADQLLTLRFASDGRELTIEIEGVGELSLGQQLQPLDGARVELGASLPGSSMQWSYGRIRHLSSYWRRHSRHLRREWREGNGAELRG